MTTERVLNSEISSLLSVVQRDEAAVETAADADALPTVEIRKLGLLYFTPTAVRVRLGGYSCTWVPTETGSYQVLWTFYLGGDRYITVEAVEILADIEGVSDSAYAPDPAAEDVPAVGADHVCKVTGQFYDAGGAGMEGVLVRFTPDRSATAFLATGIIAAEVTCSSDVGGVVEFYTVRGVTGTLAISGVGITRQVTIPDVETIDLQGLVDSADDPLEVQTPVFYALPRRSL